MPNHPNTVPTKIMASKTGILAVAFLSFAFLLPLLASAFLPGIVKPGHGFFHIPAGEEPRDHDGDDSFIIPEPEDPWRYMFPKPDPEPDPEPEPEPDPEPEPEPEHKHRPKVGEHGLREGFYAESCPQAENIIEETIQKHFVKDPRFAPAIVRMFFHDCFVTGCDGSVLLDATPTGEAVEKTAVQNGKFIRGFDVIEDIKTQLEAECPGVVSCADIIAYANRDSLVHTGVPRYEVAAGRRDGLASLAKNVPGNLPLPETTAEENIRLFQKKGMTLDELVVLIGAHSIGTAHCTIVSPRFHDPVKSKEIDLGYLLKMQTLTACRNDTQDLAFDSYSAHKMDSRFYKELLASQALLESDHYLAKEPRTRNVMEKLVGDQTGWLAKFTAAVTKLGNIEVLTGDKGEIRKQCNAVNGN